MSRHDEPVVESLMTTAQWSQPVSRKRNASFKVLVFHLFASFLGADVAGLRLLQLAVALVLPPLLYVLGALPSYNGVLPLFTLRSMRFQVADHFVLITYAYCVTAIATLFAWERFFPTLQDLRILGVLPLSPKKLFSARLCAMASFFSLLFLVPNTFPALLLFGGDGAAHLLRQMLAHAASLGLAAAFGASSVLLLLMLSRMVPNLEPLVQGILLAAHSVLLLACPKISIRASDMLQGSSVAGWCLPPAWFTGLYESIWQGASAPQYSGVLAGFAVKATLASVILAVLAYPWAYWRQERRLVEGLNPASVRAGMSWPYINRLRNLLVPLSGQRAGFLFAHKTMLRVKTFRTMLLLSLSTAAALAIVTATDHKYFPAPAELAVLSEFLAAGCIFAAFASQHQAAAAWVFETADPRAVAEAVQGSQRWLMCAAVSGAFVNLAILLCFRHRFSLAFVLLLVILPVISWAASEYLFRDAALLPFVQNRFLSRQILSRLATFLIVLLPASILALHHWWAACCLAAGCVALFLSRRIIGEEIQEPIPDDDFLQLGL